MSVSMNGAIYKQSRCGCKVVGTGTLPDPLRVEFCAGHQKDAHSTASTLIAAVADHRDLLRELVKAGRGLLASMGEEERLGHLADHTEGWDRAVKKLEAEVERAAAEVGS